MIEFRSSQEQVKFFHILLNDRELGFIRYSDVIWDVCVYNRDKSYLYSNEAFGSFESAKKFVQELLQDFDELKAPIENEEFPEYVEEH